MTAAPRSILRPTRRRLLVNSMIGVAGAIVLPAFIPRSFLSGNEPGPNKRIQVAQIGVGRMGTGDMGKVMDSNLCRVVAVCDLDALRLAAAKDAVVEHYKKKGEQQVEVKAYHDYHDILARTDIDAVVVSTPDHWHAQIAIEAALAGKDIYCQKPLTYNIAEAIALRTATHAKGRILQVGSQQRSSYSFRRASELVRAGAIGKLKTIKVGVGKDSKSNKKPIPQDIPKTLDFERWLGPAPEQAYMEGRVHPQDNLGRPGWITTEDFGLGMITNWGAHHIDIAQWAMGMELSGPTSIDAKADFMQNDMWTVHHTYHIEMGYANGVTVIMDNTFENGLRFEGDNGWIFCCRGAERITASDPNLPAGNDKSLMASDPAILNTTLADTATLWMSSAEHHSNWLEAIISRKDPIAPVDQGVRSLEACAAAWIGMKLGRKLTWDPSTERFVNDDGANAMRFRKPRKSDYDITTIMAKAGLPCAL